MARTTVPAQPRWTTRVGLGLVVLAVHLWLLAGGLPNGAVSEPEGPAGVSAVSGPVQDGGARADQPPAAEPVRARPVSVSQVRWIVPAPPPPARAAVASGTSARPQPQVQDQVQAAADAAATPPVRSSAERPTETTTAPVDTAAPAATSAPTADSTDARPSAATTPPGHSTGEAHPPAAGPLPPARVPGSARLSFDMNGTIKGLAYSADATLDWTVSPGQFDARMAVRLPLLGSRVQTSSGRVDASGLLPERFSDQARQERATHFDHEQRRIRFSSNAPQVPLQAGAQDRLSVFLQLAARFNAAPEPADQVIELQVAGTGSADRWRFRVGEEETLSLPAGELRARRLVREALGPHDTRVELWLAPSLEHLPVRIRLEQANGDQIDQRLKRLP
jgi:hypothetical protein